MAGEGSDGGEMAEWQVREAMAAKWQNGL